VSERKLGSVYGRYEDEELADTASMGADVLRGLARRWRFRIQAGRLGLHSMADSQRLVNSLEAAAKLIEEGMPAVESPRSRTEGMSPVVTTDDGEERFRLLVDGVTDYAIFMLDPEGRITSWNAGAERINGYRAQEILGRHLSIFYPKEDAEAGKPQREIEQATREGRYVEEGWRVRQSGERYWAYVTLTALRTSQGRLRGFAKVTRDLSEVHETMEALRQSEERSRLLIESVRDYAIFMLDTEGRISTWNSGAENIKGYRAEEVLGKHFSIFYPPEQIALGRPEREIRIATSEGRYEEEGWRVRKDGERFWANVILTAVYDAGKNLRGFAKVTRDLTDRRRIEEEARHAAEEVGKERAKASEAQHAVRMRDEFISIAAHELRTPLTALQLKLQGAAQGLKRASAAPGGIKDSKLTERLEGAVRQVDRLIDLVERLLDVSRIVAGKLLMQLEETDLTEVVRHVVEDFHEPALQGGSEVRFEAAGAALGLWDKARIEQVAINLISNAIKYGGGKPIEVKVESTDTGARLVVADKGIGIAADDLHRIFVRFERAVSVRHYAGLGLGLYVTRSIVEAHGGSIDVSSAAGQGSTFVVELPRRPVLQGAPSLGTAESHP
jgi:PAS domain S-box-containing protein